MSQDPLHDALLRGLMRATEPDAAEPASTLWFPVVTATAILVSAIYALIA